MCITFQKHILKTKKRIVLTISKLYFLMYNIDCFNLLSNCYKGHILAVFD